MKMILALALLVASPALAHEGENHGREETGAGESEGHDHGTEAQSGGHGNHGNHTQPDAQKPVEVYTTLASHLSFKAAHLHAFWSQPPEVNKAVNLRLELRDIESHDTISERPLIYVGYRLVGSAQYKLAQVAPLLTVEGKDVGGFFDTQFFVLDKAGEWEIFVILQRPGLVPEVKSFKAKLGADG